MRLKRLELFGFKSFADRTVLDLSEHTLTGIVGPNGCGKSNVVDSVRWALGEMRPTSLRGEGMADVIFKGSASRPPMAMAEVSIVLDNEDGTFEGRGPEVSVQRRLYRDGEGEYRIDGERVRLKDLRDLLYDTGLGSRGYSVLEQGKIDAVLSANPVQRRAIFEEAAGISRYRQRRHETELRLKRTEQDLLRLEDLMGERS
jgi:chromosome segregation protein